MSVTAALLAVQTAVNSAARSAAERRKRMEHRVHQYDVRRAERKARGHGPERMAAVDVAIRNAQEAETWTP